MKKVIDIISDENDTQGPVWLRKNQGEKKHRERKPAAKIAQKPKKKLPKKMSFALPQIILLAGAVIVAGLTFLAVWFTLNPKLNLSLLQKQTPIEVSAELELNVSQAATTAKIIPAQFLPAIVEKTSTFQATGVAFEDTKAEGVIKVYNNSNPPVDLTLVASTRFLSSGGSKIFRAVEKVILPAPTMSNGKVVGSTANVKVVAQDVGEEYNIGPSKFVVPGLAGGKLYFTIRGESTSAMAGGARKEVGRVSIADRDKAQEGLYKLLRNLLLAEMKEKTPAGFTVDERAILEDDFVFSCSGLATTSQEKADDLSFSCTGKLIGRALVFKMADIKAAAINLLNEKKEAWQDLRSDSLQISFVPKGVITQSGRLNLSLLAGVKAFQKTELDELQKQVAGKNQAEIEQILSSQFPQIEKPQFKFWPFWAKRAPSTLNDIKIYLTF
ncbi:hypothetical protein COS21_00325 [bacterium (Candidatus Gribaldobacteria) CG02_land_8_20_14_3_00_41_15]|uniref:Baseplate protein J-like domain-containing protein n=5 Tax=Candidatus Gribaldobacteria TaxID=2798536 RepID=A0A2H0UYE4_9BACT|nr:MAG: hypothetical protein AUJ36_03245 [Parcubacteria group bacterium CG1_02_41_26]PIR91843.1 MAG: hypothetical protein COU03_00275 [bacterium (Candidatus Gribaldobacteria) CG10_big_fil_rev_8_21_14_0_10_41_12]PIV47369.1 MAG: hypothetical protein COS21_00325 [bacterium (Candidatus Gribaldobacteria) CG02_land_8_20_14_3_00_41_15]